MPTIGNVGSYEILEAADRLATSPAVVKAHQGLIAANGEDRRFETILKISESEIEAVLRGRGSLTKKQLVHPCRPLNNAAHDPTKNRERPKRIYVLPPKTTSGHEGGRSRTGRKSSGRSTTRSGPRCKNHNNLTWERKIGSIMYFEGKGAFGRYGGNAG